MAQDRQELTGLEFELMQVIWRDGASTAAAVQAALHRKLAYTTVQTVLNTLYRKGRLNRTLDGRAHVYSASLTEAHALRTAVRSLLERAFGGSGEALVMSLLRSREIAPERLKELSEMLAEEEMEPGAGPKSGRKRRGA